MQERLIVIGGTAAGLSAASAVRRLKKDMIITVYERTGYISYGSCGLPYYIGGIIKEADELVTFTPSQLESSRNIAVKIHHEVTAIDRTRKVVFVRDLDTGACFEDSYDKLVIATGASAVRLPVPGADKKEIYTVRHVEDGIAIRQALSGASRQVVIVGAGYIGLEMAAELSAAGHSITLVEALPALLPAQPAEYSDLIRGTLEAHQVRLLLDTKVQGFTGEDTVTGVLTNKGEIPADLVVVSVGVRPNSALAAQAGLTLGCRNTIAVDASMVTEDPDIYACGDCAATFSILDGAPEYIPLGTTANKQGKVAGQNIGGNPQKFRGVLGSQITKVFEYYIGATGLTQAAAEKRGFQCASCAITKADRASYYPGRADNKLTLVFEKNTGRLLGASAVGSETISGRLNVLAAAITAGMTVEELSSVDFVYAPPVAPVYDPLLIAASQSLKRV